MSRRPSPDVSIAPPSATRDRTVQSAVHVCDIFDCFADGLQARTLTEIAKAIKLKNSSAYRLLQTLVTCGYLAVDKPTKMYRLGARLGRLRSAYDTRQSLATVCAPSLERLRSRLRETTSLQIRDGNARYNIVELPSSEHIRMELGQNVLYPFPAGASADVLRAFSRDWATEPDSRRLNKIRRVGFAVSYGVLVRGGRAVYVPLYDSANELIGALGIYGPEFRLRRESMSEIVGVLKRASTMLGESIVPGLPLQ